MKKSNNFNTKDKLIVVNKVLEYNRVVTYTVFSVYTGTFKEWEDLYVQFCCV